MERTLTVSAPGKVILFGEHAVVYGYPAIAVSVGLRCHFTSRIRQCNDPTGSLSICFHDINQNVVNLRQPENVIESLADLSPEEILAKVHELAECSLQTKGSTIFNSVCVCYYLLMRIARLVPFDPIHSCMLFQSGFAIDIDVNSDIPTGAGLGSSAAFCVAATTTFLLLSGCFTLAENFSPSEKHLNIINSLSREAEAIIHVTSSGLDTTVSTLGGAIRYMKSDSEAVYRTISSPQPSWNILVVNSKISRSTATVVRAVADRFCQDPDTITTIFGSLGVITDHALEILGTGRDGSELASLFKKSQNLLTGLGVSCQAIDDIVKDLNELGLAAKLTGAGWGGCVIALPFSSNSTAAEVFRRSLTFMRQKNLWAEVIPTFVDGVAVGFAKSDLALSAANTM